MVQNTKLAKFGFQNKILVSVFCMGTLVPVSSHAEPIHPVFDFMASRLLAHIEQGGFWLDARSPGFAKYTHGKVAPGWALNASIKEIPYPVALAPQQATLFIPSEAFLGNNPTLTMRLYVPQASSVSAHLGSLVLPEQKLQPGENTVSWIVSQKMVFPAEQKPLRLSFGKVFSPAYQAAAVAWIHIGTTPSQAPPEAFSGKNQALLIPGNGTLYYAMQLPPEGFFVFAGKSETCSLEVLLQEDLASDKPVRLSVTWDERPIPIPKSSTQTPVWVGLHAKGSCKQLALTTAQIQMPGPTPTVPTIKPPKRIILWLSDDTRVDRLRAWNPTSRVQTPFLDEVLGPQATRFAVAYAQGNESRVSHASLFTGLYPAQHHMIEEKATLRPELLLMSEAVKQAGLRTACYTANGYVSQRWGFGDGWDEFHNYIHEKGELSGEALVQQFTHYLKRNRNQSFFFFLGSIDAHVSWRAREPWISQYDQGPYKGPFIKGLMDPQLDQIIAGKLGVTQRDKERALALYDSNLSYTDAQLRRLWETLQQEGLLEDTMLIFTSDHGEEFWEYGKIGHGQSLHPELVHVPLYIYYPPLFPKGKVVTEGVELIDILPTLLEAMGKQAPAPLQGQSLIPLANGLGHGFARPAVASQYEKAYTMRLGHLKITVDAEGKKTLYEVGTLQPTQQEGQPLVSHHTAEARALLDPLALWMAYQKSWSKSRFGVPNNHTSTFAAQFENQR